MKQMGLTWIESLNITQTADQIELYCIINSSAKKCEKKVTVSLDEPRMADEFATKYGKLQGRINQHNFKDVGEASSLDLRYEYGFCEDSKWRLM